MQVIFPAAYLHGFNTGMVNSNQHLVVCDFGFNVPTPPYWCIRIAFMRALGRLSIFK
jgi:hypothetical protein